jgi:serine/threonine-protein kinase HipA
MSKTKEIIVYADWEALGAPQFMGVLTSSSSRGKEIFSFEYDKQWLQSPFAHTIDPDLGLYAGRQYSRDEKSNFGTFMDSSPDRWGRVLMERRESILARMENRPRRNLTESDYLLGVFDEHRMGALRFKKATSGVFVNNDRSFATPPWTSLRELEQASYHLENDLIANDTEILKWLNILLAPGSSLGGARPKAGVLNAEGSLWIAKFPSRDDYFDVGMWEMLAHDLAQAAGINVAPAMVRKFYGKHHTFLTKRFDRTASGKRLHFASAMTLLGYTDGSGFQDGVSYLELVAFILQNGADTNGDLKELFKRIVFSVCIRNTDDHLRNHGFLLTKNGWILSPAFDLNPNPKGIGLKLNISTNDNSLNLDLVAEVAPFFRLTNNEASQIIQHIENVVSQWHRIAAQYKIPKEEQDRMSPAFSH